MRNIISKILFTLLVLTMGIGQVWGTCDPGTIFKFEVKNGLTNGNVATGDNVDLSSYINLTAGSVSAKVVSAGNLTVINQKYLNIANKGNAYFICNLPSGCTLQAGDVITYSIGGQNFRMQAATNSADDDKLAINKPSTAYNSLTITIPAGHDLVGKSTFYLFAASNGGAIKSIEIARPATITLNATANGGTAVDAVKGVVGGKAVLTHAFKKDTEPVKYYKFKGWYAAPSGGDPVANYYEVTGDETLYAQFDDNPTSGVMFSLAMQSSMKPSTEVTVKSGAGYVTELDLLQYALISGGAAKLKNSSTSNHAKITTSGQISLAGSNGNIQIDLDFPLAVGDVIAPNVSAKTWITTASATSRPSSGPYADNNTDTKTYTLKEGDAIVGATSFILWQSSNATTTTTITITRPTPHTLSSVVDPAGKGTVTLGTTSLVEGATTTATYSAIASGYEFDEWQISGTGASLSDASGDHVTVTMGSTDATVTLKLKEAVTKYTITYSKGANGTGTAIPNGKKDEGVDFTLSDATYDRDGYVQTGWATEDGGAKAYDLGGTYSTDADEELFPFWTPVYTVTKGTHEHGDFTISPASLVAGGTVTLDPTPADGYMFSAWEVVKTSDASATGITVTNKQFEMPAYGVTVNATFVADTRKKVLYLTSNTAEATVSNDKLYAALKDDYNVTIAAPASQTLTDYDLVVLHESIGGTSSAAAVTGCKTTSVPVLNTKSYFYNNANTSDRWGWGTPNAGQSVKGCTPNAAYCNIADHPIFADVIDAGFVEITDDAAAKCMQPIGAFTTGLEGYTLATTPNNGEGNGCAIHEIPAGNSVRGAGTGKYLMISVSNAKLNALNANGQKLFQNAAAYLIDGSTTWTPITVPTSPEVTATPSENYTEGNTITLTASATGTTASTTYTWYKGDNWAAASATTPVQAAATAASDGNVFTKTAALADAGTYWCNISNGTSCDVQASVTITVASASTPTHAISYDNVKGADMSAYPTEYTEGVGVASFDPLADITGWHFVEWSPASIANDATTDQTITAVWAQVFEVTFNLNGQSGSFDAQDIISGGKVTKPVDPIVIGQEFGGWYKEAGCANAWDFNTDVITEATVLYAKWTAFTGCTELWPATSGDAPTAEGDEINMQTGSTGATMTVLAKANKLAYTSAGLQFGSESGVKVNVVLNNEIVVGTRISMTLVAGGEKTRGLFLYDANGNKINAFTCWVDGTNAASNGAEETFTYTVVANDGLAGTNEFQLWRNNTVYLKSLKVSNCGDAIIYHNLTSEVNIAGKGTVTLGASSVREGLTTTAEYSAIDEAYEFVNWTVSGEGASIADATANPATITMGTGDAVVTLNLQLKPVYYTVTYKDGESSMGTEQVVENGHPTATGITTAKKGYNFLGWSETDGGAVVELSTITITAATNIYAKYEAIPCPTYGTVFSMNVTDPADTEYNENNEFSLEIGATYTGGKAYSGSKSSTKRLGKIDANGEYSFNANGDVTVKIELDCALQEGDVLSFTSTPSRELKIQKVAGTDLYTTSGKTFTIPAASPLIGEYEFYLMRDNSQSTFKTFNIYRPAVLTGVTLDDAVVAIGGIVTPTMTLAPVADAYVSSQVWSIEGAGEGTIANIDPSTGEVTGVALGSVTVKVVLNGSIENTCTVTVIESYTQLDVTETSEWNFAGAAAASSKKSFPNTTEEFLLANISGVNNTPEFNARALVVKGKYVSNSQLQAQTIRFNVATSGKLTIRYACTSDKGDGNDRELYINGVATGSMTSNGEVTYTQVVPGGEVTIKALYDKESVLTEDIMNYKYIKFDVNPDVSDADYIRTTTEGRYGTICLPNGGVMVGADLFEVAYYGATSQKIFFDQIMNGEMEAGIPYIFLPKEGVSQLGVYYTDAAGSTAGNRNGLYGSYTTEVLARNDGNYVLYNNQYLYVGDESTNVKVGANRAYIKLAEITPIEPALAPGRRRVSMGVIGAPQVTTGVGELNADETPIKVMIDGQLYIIRGEKMYDATGRLVK